MLAYTGPMARALLAFLLLPLPAAAEWLSFELIFRGTGCASCIESLPQRLQRMRGVESVEVDAERSMLKVRLAAGNRVRLELIRDQIEQDGTKVISGRVDGVGNIAREAGGAWSFRLAGTTVTYPIDAAGFQPVEAALRIVAEVHTLRPTPALRLIEHRRHE